MQLSELQGGAQHNRPSATDRVLGTFGAAVIGLTLLSVRIWARVTRTPYLKA